MKSTIILAALLACGLGAQAQVIKCTVGGKTVYSDRPCTDGSAGKSVNTQSNTIDSTGPGRDVAWMKAEQRKEKMEAMMRNPPDKCRFTYHTYGDKRGKALAADAKRECVQDHIAASEGSQSSGGTGHDRWREHHAAETTKRQNDLARQQSADKVYRCRKAMVGNDLECR